MSINKTILVGNLGADPTCRYTTAGKPVGDLRLATSRKWTSNDGQVHEDTQWHRIVVWGKQAENCQKYLSKGQQVYIEGRLQTRQWVDKDGNKRYTTEVVAKQVQFLGGNPQKQAETKTNTEETETPAEETTEAELLDDQPEEAEEEKQEVLDHRDIRF